MSFVEKNVGLVCATRTEYLVITRQLREYGFMLQGVSHNPNFEWITGLFYGKRILLAKSGIGKVSAAMTVQSLIDSFHPDIVIGMGVAGGLNSQLALGSVVLTDDCEEWDCDLSSLGIQVQEAQPRQGVIFEKATEILGGACITGKILTGDTFIADPEKKEELKVKYGAIAVDMESAAVARVCRRNEVPFIIVKGISDNAGLGASTDLRQNLEQSVSASFSVLRQLLVKDII